VGEILHGVLRASPRPSPRHAATASVLGGALFRPFAHAAEGAPGDWLIVDEPQLRLLDDVVVPDLAAWRRSRMPALPETAYFELAPDWVCEVIAPGMAALDRVDKLPVYAREQVPHTWLVDPAERLLEVYRLEGRRWSLLDAWHGDVKVRAEPFESVELDLGLLWVR
jgi:Uma2 family endonuclease